MKADNAPRQFRTPAGHTPHGAPRLLRVFLSSWAVLTALIALWAIATPIAASPDEPAHMVKAAAVVRGEFIGPMTPTGNIVHVPRYIAETHFQTCFAFDPAVSADCQQLTSGESSEIVEARTTAGLYNPVYYLVTGAPTLLFDDDSGIYAMRFLSGALTALFLAMAISMITQWRVARSVLLAFAVSVTPMLLFLGASVNPNAVEAAAIATVFVGVLSFVTRSIKPRQYAAAATMVGLAGAMAVNARGLSPVWLFIAVVVPCLWVPWADVVRALKLREVLGAIATVALGTAFAVAWLLGSNSLTAAVTDPDAVSPYAGVGESWFSGFITVIEKTFEYGRGLVGLFGWLDTPSPPSAIFLWSALVGGFLLVGLVTSRGKALVSLLAILLATVLAPALIQAFYVTDGGYIWQGRYTLPLFLCLMIALGATAAPLFAKLSLSQSKRLVWMVTVAVAASQFYTFAIVLRRYVVGEPTDWITFFTASEWAPPGGKIAILAGYAVLAAGTAFLLGRTLLALPAEYDIVSPRVTDTAFPDARERATTISRRSAAESTDPGALQK